MSCGEKGGFGRLFLWPHEKIERGSDTELGFVLRRVNVTLADDFYAPRKILTRLWEIMDTPDLNRLLACRRMRG
jgi:hypothetical protein